MAPRLRISIEWLVSHAIVFLLFVPWARMEGDAGKYGFTALPFLFACAQLYPLKTSHSVVEVGVIYLSNRIYGQLYFYHAVFLCYGIHALVCLGLYVLISKRICDCFALIYF
jgi:hypothetical protein